MKTRTTKLCTIELHTLPDCYAVKWQSGKDYRLYYFRDYKTALRAFNGRASLWFNGRTSLALEKYNMTASRAPNYGFLIFVSDKESGNGNHSA